MAFLRRLTKGRQQHDDAEGYDSDHQTQFVDNGNLKFAIEKGENSSEPSYQEVSGAPVESRSPLGYHVGTLTIVSAQLFHQNVQAGEILMSLLTMGSSFLICRRWSELAFTAHQRESLSPATLTWY